MILEEHQEKSVNFSLIFLHSCETKTTKKITAVAFINSVNMTEIHLSVLDFVTSSLSCCEHC